MAPLPYPPTLAPSPALRKAKTVPPPPSEADHQAPGPVRLEHGSVGAVTFANPRDVDRELEHDVRRRLDLRFMGRRGTDGELQNRSYVTVMSAADAWSCCPRYSRPAPGGCRASARVPVDEATPARPLQRHARADCRGQRAFILSCSSRPTELTVRTLQKRFLTTMPEVAHVPYELLHEPILTAHKAAVETATTGPAWDPYEGNRIATTSAQNIFFANQAAVGLVAFPTGQLGQELSPSLIPVRPSALYPAR